MFYFAPKRKRGRSTIQWLGNPPTRAPVFIFCVCSFLYFLLFCLFLFIFHNFPSFFNIFLYVLLVFRILSYFSIFFFIFLWKSIGFERSAIPRQYLGVAGGRGTVLGAQGRKNNRRKHWICAKLTKTAGHQMAGRIQNLSCVYMLIYRCERRIPSVARDLFGSKFPYDGADFGGILFPKIFPAKGGNLRSQRISI